MRASVRILMFAAIQAFGGSAFADEPKAPVADVPSKVLIPGVPYVSWSEAAQWRYEHKDILNPSAVATFKMIRRYWGQDGFRLFQFGLEEYMPEHWKGAEASQSGTGLADLKSWLARGVPVAVNLPFTPHAHPIPVTALIGVSMKGVKLPDRGPSSRGLGRWASWEDQLQLLSGVGAADELRYGYIREVIHMASRVVIGYDDERKVMMLHDPSFGPAWEMGYSDFESNWRLNGFNYNARPPQGYADFVAKRPASGAYPARTPDMQAAVHFAFGYGFSEVGRAADAERELEKGLAVAGVGNGYRHVLAFELAFHRRAANRIEEAIALLRQAIEALPEAPGPYKLLSEIYNANPSLPGAQQAAVEIEQAWKSRFNTRAGLSVVLKTLPRDFQFPVWQQFRGWACEPDFRNSRC